MTRNVLLAAILGPHGLKGELRVKCFTATPGALGDYGPLKDTNGTCFTIAQLRPTKPDEAVVRFTEVSDRNAAERLKGTELFVPRDALGAAGEEEFYHADLMGLRAEDETGRVLGTVCGVHNFGAGDVLEIARDDGDTVMLPFTREVVPLIEVDKGRLILAAPEEVEAQGETAKDKGTVE